MKVFFIDGYGPFTHILVDQFRRKDCEVVAYRDNVDIRLIDNAIKKLKPELIVVSGYGKVEDSENFVQVVRDYCGKTPIFGVGLGHHCIIGAFEGKVDKCAALHGKTAKIKHDNKTIFRKIPNPFNAARYNSLAGVDIPYTFEVSARSEDDIVMGIRHKEYFVESIDFHPESLLTLSGSQIIENVIREAKR
jgi:anthranilate synthase/aminodeoxychorismate synthase-like glutamine amidotransferase